MLREQNVNVIAWQKQGNEMKMESARKKTVMSKNELDILEYLGQCPVIDTHEHLEWENMQPSWNVLCDYTRHYFISDLISSGMPPGIKGMLADPDLSITEKWRLLEPYWERCRYTGYGQALDIVVQKLYGVDGGLNGETIEAVEEGYQKLHGTPGYGRKILRDMCNIEYCIVDSGYLEGDSESGLFRFVTQLDGWVLFDPEDLLEWRGVEANPEDIADVDDWVALCLHTLDGDFVRRGASAMKLAVAYKRALGFDTISHERAQRDFEKWRSGGLPGKAAQDYVMHAILRFADERRLILQIHTGHQEGETNLVTNANPALLNGLFILYPNVRFDLFHIGWPWQSVMGSFGKMFPNIRLNMCWAHMLSPKAARDSLYEWMYTVPLNKVFAFGGDCEYYDGVAGHLELAKRNVAAVLSTCVGDGVFSVSEARKIARKLFYENAKEFYDDRGI